jgi:hypothetical protein
LLAVPKEIHLTTTVRIVHSRNNEDEPATLNGGASCFPIFGIHEPSGDASGVGPDLRPTPWYRKIFANWGNLSKG